MFKESKAMRQEKINETLISVVESWATTDNPFNSIDEILAWVRKKIAATKVSVRLALFLCAKTLTKPTLLQQMLRQAMREV